MWLAATQYLAKTGRRRSTHGSLRRFRRLRRHRVRLSIPASVCHTGASHLHSILHVGHTDARVFKPGSIPSNVPAAIGLDSRSDNVWTPNPCESLVSNFANMIRSQPEAGKSSIAVVPPEYCNLAECDWKICGGRSTYPFPRPFDSSAEDALPVMTNCSCTRAQIA